MTKAEEELLKAFGEFKPAEFVEEYRAYYNEDKTVRCYMANNFPNEDTNWINISREEYISQDYQWKQVLNGSLVKIIPDSRYRFPLTSSNKGVKVVKNHAGLLLEPDETYEDVEYYDKRNN